MTRTLTLESSAAYRRFIWMRPHFIRLIEEGLQECCGFCKLENDENVRVALTSCDPKKVAHGVKIWYYKTLKKIKTLEIVKAYSSKKGVWLITTIFLWSCISCKCEMYMENLTKLATKTINPLEGFLVMETAINSALSAVIELALKWLEVDQPDSYKSWYCLLLMEDVMPSIYPLVHTSPKNNRQEAIRLTNDFRDFVTLDTAARKQKPDLPSWPINNVSTNAEFLEAAKKAISTSKVLSEIISGFFQQQALLQARTNNNVDEASVPEKLSVESKEVSFEDLRPAQYSAVSALKNIKLKLEAFYLYLNDNFEGSVDTFKNLGEGADHYIQIIEDKSNPDSLGKSHPEEVWAIGTVVRQLIQTSESDKTKFSEIEAVLINWLESELQQDSTNSNRKNL